MPGVPGMCCGRKKIYLRFSPVYALTMEEDSTPLTAELENSTEKMPVEATSPPPEEEIKEEVPELRKPSESAVEVSLDSHFTSVDGSMDEVPISSSAVLGASTQPLAVTQKRAHLPVR